MIIERGIDQTKMDDISDAADLGRQTLYNHFPGKQECVLAAVVSAYSRHTAAAEKKITPDLDPAAAIANGILGFINGLLRDPITKHLQKHPKLLATAMNNSAAPLLKRDIQRGLELGRFHPALDETQLSSMLIWSIVGLINDDKDLIAHLDSALLAFTSAFLMTLGLSLEDALEVTANSISRPV